MKIHELEKAIIQTNFLKANLRHHIGNPSTFEDMVKKEYENLKENENFMINKIKRYFQKRGISPPFLPSLLNYKTVRNSEVKDTDKSGPSKKKSKFSHD